MRKDIDSESAESTSDDEFYIGSVTVTENESENVHDYEEPLKIDSVGDAGTTQWSITLETAGEDISYNIDTGAQVNVLPKKYFDRLSPCPKLKSTAVKLSAYNDTSISVAGKSLIPLIYTYLQNKRMRRCGVAPPPIIFERLKLPQQIIYRRKENLSESLNHQKYWENILVSQFYEQFSRNRRNLGHFRKFEKISNS